MRQTELNLSEEDRSTIEAIRSKGVHQAREVNRAHVLCSGQVISDSLIGFFDVDSRSKALGDKLPSFECSLTAL